MVRLITSAFLFLMIITQVCNKIYAQSQVLESLSIQSEILETTVPFSVYLPDGYNSSNQKYPILYLLHGGGGNETDWLVRGNIQNIMDNAIQEGHMPRTIVIMPSSLATHYVNSYDGKMKYKDMFIQEFIPKIESTYRCRTDRDSRGIAGLSRGGYGSLLYAITNPDLFRTCVALSSALRTDEEFMNYNQEDWMKRYYRYYGGETSDKRLKENYRSHSPLDLILNQDIEKIKTIYFYIDCGDDDYLINGNMLLHQRMNELGIKHEFRVRDGAHTWSYWRSGLAEGLKFTGFYMMGGW